MTKPFVPPSLPFLLGNTCSSLAVGGNPWTLSSCNEDDMFQTFKLIFGQYLVSLVYFSSLDHLNCKLNNILGTTIFPGWKLRGRMSRAEQQDGWLERRAGMVLMMAAVAMIIMFSWLSSSPSYRAGARWGCNDIKSGSTFGGYREQGRWGRRGGGIIEGREYSVRMAAHQGGKCCCSYFHEILL